MADVAAAAGVSIMTVSRVYKNPNKVTLQTRRKILAAAGGLGYVPNLVARNLASGRGRVIAAVVPSLRNSNYATLIQGLSDALTARQYHLLLAIADSTIAERPTVELILGLRPDGLVLTGTHHSARTRAMVTSSGVPVVETWEIDGPFLDMAVGFSAYDAAREMTQYLIAKGHSHIGYVGHHAPGVARFEDRRRGWKDTLRKAKLRADRVYLGSEDAGFAIGRLAVDTLTKMEPRITALFCATDIFAAGALFECLRRGWDVPRRLAISGYGNYEIGKEIPIGLTTIKTHGYEVGSAAADLLLRRREGEAVETAIRNVGYEIVVRDSA